ARPAGTPSPRTRHEITRRASEATPRRDHVKRGGPHGSPTDPLPYRTSGKTWQWGFRRARPGFARTAHFVEPAYESGDSQVKLRPEEITSILKARIEQYEVETDLAEVGTVLQVGDGIARVYGLESSVAMEMLEFDHGVTGIAFNLEEDNVGSALFGEWELVKEGESVRRTSRVASVPVGDELVGRIVNPLGQPIDGGPPLEGTERRPLEFKAPGVVDRQPVKEPVQTGIKAIDSMIPIGRGQRELIIGDRSVGKTA